MYADIVADHLPIGIELIGKQYTYRSANRSSSKCSGSVIVKSSTNCYLIKSEEVVEWCITDLFWFLYACLQLCRKILRNLRTARKYDIRTKNE